MSGDMTTAAMSVAQKPILTPAATSSIARAQKAGKDFEASFLTQMLGQMFSGIETDQTFGGGQGETMFRSLMLDEYGKQIAAQGGIGLASTITAQLLKHQEVASSNQQAPSTATQPAETQAATAKSTQTTPVQESAP